ncbi:T9SS type A sorting domain-containing protein [bacterium]|nr:T9SS type A sorting domain-containing protein [bacterium]
MFNKKLETVILLPIVMINIVILPVRNLSSQTMGIWSTEENSNLDTKGIYKPDRTQASVIYLGNPFKDRYPDNTEWEYARNVWDMILWNQKIYFGHGDVARNSGPTDIWYYDISEQNFINEFTADEEQIYRFREFNDCLYIPGHDPTESHDFGNFYVNKGEGWEKYRTIPVEVHVNDIFIFHDSLFVTGSKGIYASADSGLSWYNYGNSGSEFFVFKDQFYCEGNPHCVFRYNGSGFLEENVHFLPDNHNLNHIMDFKGSLIYINRENLYTASDIDNYKMMDLFTGKNPRDIIIKEDTLFILLSTEWTDDCYLTEVFSTEDLESWHNEFEIMTSSFALSFEYFSGSFYISLGTEFYPDTNSIGISGSIFQIIPTRSLETAERSRLFHNYPNPFNTVTTIKYHLQKSDFMTIKIYNLNGQEVETLVNGYQTAGVHYVKWFAEGLPSGLYLCRLHAGDFSEAKKLILQK